MSPEQRLTEGERSNLVAYLDGELNEAESRALAAKLTRSVSARSELEALEKSWELLEYLPRPQVPPDFTARTLSEVGQLAALDDQWAETAGRATRQAVQVLVCALSMALTLGLGYAATRWLWPDPTSRLVRDLPLAEHLDEYREVGSFEFLNLLDESPDLAE